MILSANLQISVLSIIYTEISFDWQLFSFLSICLPFPVSLLSILSIILAPMQFCINTITITIMTHIHVTYS